MKDVYSFLKPFLICTALAVVSGILFFTTVAYMNRPPRPALSLLHTSPDPSSHSLSPVLSNQWYSSLVSQFPSSPLYALPLVYKFDRDGIGFSYPDIVKTPDSIAASYKKDFVIGLPQEISKPTLEAVGDWHIRGNVKTSNAQSLTFTIGHGLPYVLLTAKAQYLTVSLPAQTDIYNNNTRLVTNTAFQTQGFRLVTQHHTYAFFFDKSVKVSPTDTGITIQNPARIVVALLDKKEHFTDFATLIDMDLKDTQVFFAVDDTKLDTTYQVTTNNKTPLLTLFPHQYDALSAKPDILGEYQSIRGSLKLVRAQSFTTTTPLLVPNGTFDSVATNSAEITSQIKKDVAGVLQEGLPDSKDYYLGKWFGKVSNLLLLADTYNLENEKEKLLAYTTPLFIKSLSNFSYDSQKTSVIAKYPEFGNENLNDHHFHYGYYIRTAAVLANFDPTLVQKMKDPITSMVKDIATTQRESSQFPFLRNFDVYEGHSWADGFGNTADGNNQESTSEAINAWYGIYLWGKITNDTQMQSYALYLYNTEIQSAQYYWFDKTGIYSAPYNHNIASIVWGGKVDFATWFSDKTNMKYGIQLLPITPASLYLGNLPSFAGYKKDFAKSGGSEQDSWGDLFTIWRSFYEPDITFTQKDKTLNLEESNTKSLFLYILTLNKSNQQNDKQAPSTP